MPEFEIGDIVMLDPDDTDNDELVEDYGFDYGRKYVVVEVKDFDCEFLRVHSTDADGPACDENTWLASRFVCVVPIPVESDEPDMVNHPPHYNSHPKGIECIDVIEDSPHFNLGQVIRYTWRVNWGGKWDDYEDLHKAKWFIEREIAKRDKAMLEAAS